ncbi:hypothetical protein [Nostoc sp.]|uniref:hypothetical protein n=1 Tax=Nostoc sp. TaxID=1180 RepID=UPI002FFBB59F
MSEQNGLSPVREEICEKLSQAHSLIMEASTTHIEGESLYKMETAIGSVMKNPAEYTSMLDEIAEKIEKVQQYILDKPKKVN